MNINKQLTAEEFNEIMLAINISVKKDNQEIDYYKNIAEDFFKEKWWPLMQKEWSLPDSDYLVYKQDFMSYRRRYLLEVYQGVTRKKDKKESK